MVSRRNTLESIIKGSIELFNQSGVSEVSTNHIASHLAMSPGNLYYYFPNKEAIVRAIFAQIRSKIEILWQDQKPALQVLSDYVNVVFNIIFGYRFFFADLSLLLRRDAVLRADYIQLQSRFKDELAELLLGFSQAGIFVALEREKRDALANSVWIVSIYWHSYLESAPHTNRQAPPQELPKHILFLLAPYIEPLYLDDVKGIFMSFLEVKDHE